MDMFDLWWLSLAIFAVVIVVVAVLLGLIIATAKSIDRHAAVIWTVGKEIAGNTVSIWMLEKTNDHLERIQQGVLSIDQSLSSLGENLRLVISARGRG